MLVKPFNLKMFKPLAVLVAAMIILLLPSAAPASGESEIQQTRLTASDGAAYDYFGVSVAISGDTAVVGAAPNVESGAAYVFSRDHGGTDNWGEVKKLAGRAGTNFGKPVAISGNTVVVGAHLDPQAAKRQARPTPFRVTREAPTTGAR